MEQRKPEIRAIKIEMRPVVDMGINYAMEDLRREYAQIQGVYEAAIREIDARLKTLDSDFSFRYQHNPIHHIDSRVKSLSSIVKKLHSMGYPISISSAKKNLHDIAGVRVVCCYVDDIYRIANLLLAQDEQATINTFGQYPRFLVYDAEAGTISPDTGKTESVAEKATSLFDQLKKLFALLKQLLAKIPFFANLFK